MKKIIGAGLAFAPFLAFAQQAAGGADKFLGIEGFLGAIDRLIGIITPIVFALALLYFFIGLAQFVMNAGNEDAQKEAKSRMVWGIIALFVMSAVFGIINFVSAQFGLTNTAIDVPEIQDLD
ncbi:MAG: hypothetical protein RJA61_719 [Candidatus Parcubacteria bacterium]|jgi:succinate dehydrogenase/fumarate reductase cytochrome b subunit